MHCERFLAYLNRGGLIRRFRARRHAKGCRPCRELALVDERLKAFFGEASPLSSSECRLWIEVAEKTPTSELPRPIGVWVGITGVAAAVLLTALGGLSWLARPEPASNQVRKDERPLAPASGASEELDALEREFRALYAELSALEKRAILLDEGAMAEELDRTSALP